jgi:hypothetical protein
LKERIREGEWKGSKRGSKDEGTGESCSEVEKSAKANIDNGFDARV